MPSNKPIIESWHAMKLSATTAEVVILGYGFSDQAGAIKLNIQGSGAFASTIKYWSDTAIVATAPVDSTIMRVHISSFDSRGKEKQVTQSPPGQTRSTNDEVPAFTVTSTDDTIDNIVIAGTGLLGVETVVLYDSLSPSKPINATFFITDDNEILVDWPPSFTSPIVKIRLSDGENDNVLEITDPYGWERKANGVITDLIPNVIGNTSVIDIYGSNLGDITGSASIAKTGGPLEPTSVISNGWSDSLVQISVDGGFEYSNLVLTRSDGEVPTIVDGALPVFVPNNAPVISAIDGLNLGIRITGTGLGDATLINLYRGSDLYQYNALDLISNYPGSILTDTVIEIRDPSADDLDPVTSVVVHTTTSSSNVVTAPDLGGPWSMDDPSTIPTSMSIEPGTKILRIESQDLFPGSPNVDTAQLVILYASAPSASSAFKQRGIDSNNIGDIVVRGSASTLTWTRQLIRLDLSTRTLRSPFSDRILLEAVLTRQSSGSTTMLDIRGREFFGDTVTVSSVSGESGIVTVVGENLSAATALDVNYTSAGTVRYYRRQLRFPDGSNAPGVVMNVMSDHFVASGPSAITVKDDSVIGDTIESVTVVTHLGDVTFDNADVVVEDAPDVTSAAFNGTGNRVVLAGSNLLAGATADRSLTYKGTASGVFDVPFNASFTPVATDTDLEISVGSDFNSTTSDFQMGRGAFGYLRIKRLLANGISNLLATEYFEFPTWLSARPSVISSVNQVNLTTHQINGLRLLEGDKVVINLTDGTSRSYFDQTDNSTSDILQLEKVVPRGSNPSGSTMTRTNHTVITISNPGIAGKTIASVELHDLDGLRTSLVL